jgi:N-acetylneuraminic acid mutarotase
MRTRLAVLGAVLSLTASGLGGCGGGSTAVAPVPAQRWVTAAPMLQPRILFGAGVVNNRVYALGGFGSAFNASHPHYAGDVESYDPSANTWTVESTAAPQRYAFAVAAIGNVLYEVGGNSLCCDEAFSVDAYDTSSHAWTTKANMHSSRAEFGLAPINNVLYAVGGLHYFINLNTLRPDKDVTNTVEAYDPSTNAWTDKAPMPTARWGIATGVVNGILYTVGGVGVNANGPVLNTVEAYDPSTNTWTTKAPMPTPRRSMAAGVVNNVLYVVGGSDANSKVLNTVEAYDPATNTWKAMPPMPTPRDWLAVAVNGNVLYALAGQSSDQALVTVEAFTP